MSGGIKTAMIMAAGHGTRMRPLTHSMSKAMVSVDGLPLIEHMLRRLESVGIEQAIVNVHAHADHLETYLNYRKGVIEIIISDEREQLLETGGGLVKALPLIGTDPVLICNIDAIWIGFEPVLAGLLKQWKPAVMDELMLLVRNVDLLGFSGAGDFDLSHTGRVSFRRGSYAKYVYAGVEIFKPQLAYNYAVETFSRKKIWVNNIAKGRVFGHVMQGYWMHVGDPKAHEAAEAVCYQYALDQR